MSFNVRSTAKIYQVLSLRLSRAARETLPGGLRDEINTWLGQWTCIRNFKALITDTKVDALRAFREEIKATVMQHNFPPEAFEFEMDSVDLKVIDGHLRFWLSTPTVRTFDFHLVVPAT